jgi:hypothetical protein
MVMDAYRDGGILFYLWCFVLVSVGSTQGQMISASVRLQQ